MAGESNIAPVCNETSGNPDLARPGPQRLLAAWRAAVEPSSWRTYQSGMRRFAAFVGASTIEDAAWGLVSGGPELAHEITLRYRRSLEDKGLASATVSRLVATLKSLVRAANNVCGVRWALAVRGPRVALLRDVRGPGLEGVQRMHEVAADCDAPLCVRDRAMLALTSERSGKRRSRASARVLDPRATL